MKIIVFVLILIVFTSCDKAHNIKVSQMENPENRTLIENDLTEEEQTLLRHALLRYRLAGKTEQIQEMSIGKLIDEQEDVEELAEQQRQERIDKMSGIIDLARTDSSRFMADQYFLETKINNKSDKDIKTVRYKITLYENVPQEGVVRRFQASDIKLPSGHEYLALHRIIPESPTERDILKKGNQLKIDYEPIAVIYKDGSTINME